MHPFQDETDRTRLQEKTQKRQTHHMLYIVIQTRPETEETRQENNKI